VISVANPLAALAGQLRADGSEISDFVVESSSPPALGELAAAGPRAAADRDAYALVFESVREGYLLHYGRPRVVAGADADLALLAGDYLYALGLERLAGLGDLGAVRELSDLISLSAQLHAEDREAEVPALWLACAAAVACGAGAEHEAAKAGMRAGEAGAETALRAATIVAAGTNGLSSELDRAADAIHFRDASETG